MDIRERLERIGNIQKNLPDERTDAIVEARKQGLTWREISSLLQMTEHGVIKSIKEKTND